MYVKNYNTALTNGRKVAQPIIAPRRSTTCALPYSKRLRVGGTVLELLAVVGPTMHSDARVRTRLQA